MEVLEALKTEQSKFEILVLPFSSSVSQVMSLSLTFLICQMRVIATHLRKLL